MKMPTLFISHGGGPWPWVEDMRSHFKITENNLKTLGQTLKPTAIISISGHWECPQFTVGSSEHPGMEYDYTGFPSHTYSLKYSAPGSSMLVKRMHELVGLVDDDRRGFDHGTFVPLFLMYPEAKIPVVTLSLKQGLDPQEHIELGQKLAPLREEGVLILGSGLTYHNLRQFFHGGEIPSKAFTAWLSQAIEYDEEKRNALLKNWIEAPYAKLSHPRADHLLPLMVVAGAAGTDRGVTLFEDNAFGVSMANYQFGSLS